MSTSGPEKLKMKSPDMALENVETIAHIFPNVVTEIRDENGEVRKGIDFDLLKQELSGNVCEGREERYEFTWVGKKQSIVEGNLPIQKTLRPCMDESKDWERTKNIYIEGDNLEALKLLQESYLNKIKMIYIDPPYNTGNDFIYNDKFVMDSDDYDTESGAVDDIGNRLIKNSKDQGRFHSDWCSMIFPRLKLAHNLLREDGIIFVSIDDTEIHNLRKMMDEIFGEESFISQFIWKSRQNKDNRTVTGVSIDHEYIICYGKSNNQKIRGDDRKLEQYSNPDNDPRGDWTSGNMVGLLAEDERPNLHYDLIDPNTGINYGRPPLGWRYELKTMNQLIKENRIIWPPTPEGRPRKKVFLKELKNEFVGYSSIIAGGIFTRNGTEEIQDLFKKRIFDFPKPSKLIRELIIQGSDKSDIILDFFAGSCPTAQAVMQLNADEGGTRKFIMIQLPEVCEKDSEACKAGFKNISEIGKERIRRVSELIEKELKEKTRQEKLNKENKNNLDIGFRVFKIDDTSMKNVYYSAAEYSQETIEGLVDNVRPDRTDLDLLYQIVIDWGLPLDLPHEIAEIDGFHIHIVDGNALIACFDANIPESVMRKIAEKKPLRAVFRDGSFRSSPGKLNIEGIFKMIAPDTTLRVI